MSSPTRRQFLQTTAAAATVAATPLFLHAENKSGSAPLRVGSGEFVYECHHYWGELPSSIQWGATHDVAIDKSGLIYITHQNGGPNVMDAIVAFDTDGKYVRSFGKEFHGGGHGLDLRAENGQEFLYLSDVKNHQIAKLDLNGEIVWKKGFPTESGKYDNPGKYTPTNIALAADGGFYVGDGYGSNYVHQYDADANWVRSFGGRGSQPGQLNCPHGLYVDTRPGREPSLCVTDRANNRLQYFTLDGEHISYVDNLVYPSSLDVQGEVLLVGELDSRLTLLDKDNNVITYLDDDAEWRSAVNANGRRVRSQRDKWVDGKFVHPHGATFDAAGNIYLAEWVVGGRVSLLKKVG
ncbi:twin-arginine translocation signal domain-containing protein [Blastopirellula sp. JC732]|uniref:Twin-arginine translocation signal domain-containing protein n=1 Tax=Blastopirellula sediminis TaxID=2894196 RepID=A0A9X1SFR0_9BACT|nr:twin-arginine translocation signal domain-containing protein [Blastopirellula sediminis]MCC9607237.1 twin-arginine translocation signal domain-containing protein [Blastopirellula sediminis]MCC9629470.1 twin-arginine translocation signal domain-containing protein [Blastopirellula sediminis]